MQGLGRFWEGGRGGGGRAFEVYQAAETTRIKVWCSASSGNAGTTVHPVNP